MTKSLIHILLVEDNPDDAEILRYELKKGGIDFTISVVDNEKDYREQLVQQPPDIVLSDFNLPQFDGGLALSILKSVSPETPFIIVSGMIGEDAAVNMIKSGCSDYLLKDKLGRLPSSIQHALEQAKEHHDRLAAIMALRESEERFRRLADNSPVLIWKSDAEKCFVYFNKGWLDFTGVALEDLMNGRWTEYIYPEDKDRVQQAFSQRFDRREKYEMEYRLRHHTGAYRWVVEIGVPNYLTNGEFVGYLGSCIDIDERKTMEERVIKSQEMLNTFFSESLDGCFILVNQKAAHVNEITKDDPSLLEFINSLTIDKINEAFSHQFLPTGELIKGKKFTDLISLDESKTKFYFLRLVEEGKVKYNLRMQRSDNTEMIAEGSLVALYDNDNRVTGCFGIQRDVTEEEKEYENLKKKADYYQRFFEEDLTGDFITRPDGSFVMVNNTCARIFGFSTPDDMYATNVKEWYVNLNDRNTIITQLIRDRKLEQVEVEMKKKDGTIFTGVINAMGKFNSKGQLLEIIGFIVDISHRKEVERQLLQSQKLESIGTLASGIAHDFNNILNNISGFSQQLQKYYDNPVKVKKYADTINLSAERGTQLATKLLSFARQRKSETMIVDVSEVIQEVVGICVDTFMKKISIEVSVAPDLWKVTGDKSGLFQMLLNLSMNARDAIIERNEEHVQGVLKITAANYEVKDSSLHWFSTSAPSHAILISIQDNGCGIPENIRDRIFDPFFTTKKNGTQKGTGLGLAIVYNSIKTHRGAVTVEGEPGNGTTFNVFLPAVESNSAHLKKEEQVNYLAKNNELILLVDDEDAMRELAQELLEEAGYRVVIAKNGREAVEIFKEKNSEVNLVVMDLVMPLLDGGQAYLEMKKVKEKFNIFFCSGFVTDELITSLLSEEHLKALQKPFKADQFLKMVHDTIY